MHGNVYEWCADWFADYPSGLVTNPEGLPSGSIRVFRGGSWKSPVKYCRSAERCGYRPEYVHYNLGFRLVRQK